MKLCYITLLLLLFAIHTVTCQFSRQCADLSQRLDLPNTTVLVTQSVAAGSNVTFPENPSSCDLSSIVVNVDLCRVAMLVATSPKTNITMETWLPLDWTGRFLSVGNGGMGGCIGYEDLVYTVEQGFASVGTNNGHDGNTAEPFYQNPEVIADYAYRSLHTGVVVGKKVTEAFYGKTHTKSYYLGCSTGGRQGFKEAQDFPEDFDGIVAGAPSFPFNRLGSWSGRFYLLTGRPDSPTFLEPELWSIVNEDILDQCDGLDGYVDGIIEDPDLCNYHPEGLICGSNQTENCLTGTQAATVRAVFSPLYGINGTFIYPRLQPGADSTNVFFTGEPYPYTTDWYRYAIYNNPDWDPATLGPEDYAASARINPFNIETWEGDLSGARDHGTRILHYHGLADPVLSSESSSHYYNHVSRTMGLPPSELDEFYRLFRISGMGHCGGGPGAVYIGNSAANVADYQPESNVLSAMVRWVEEGLPPDTILGTAYINGTKDSGQVAFQRKHCRYPTRNAYDGKGDATDPGNWHCV